MTTIENLEKQLAEALARERQLREALGNAVYELNIIRARDGVPRTCDGRKSDVTEEYFSSVVDACFAALSTSAPRVFTVDELNDICEIHRTEIANLKEQVRVFESWHKDPRVFTAEEVRPLVEALDRVYRNALIADGVNVKCVDTIWLRQEGAKAMQYARKLGMEGGE